MKRTIILGGLLAALAVLAGTAFAATIVVQPQAPNGWYFQTVGGTASGGYEVGPGVPPGGTGSLELVVGANGDDFVAMRNIDYDGVLLSDLTSMSYSTYITAHGGCVAPYIVLSIDLDNDGVFTPGPGLDDALFFEPCYQNGTYVTDPPGQIIPPQNGGGPNPTTVGSWQYWDAFIGGWWSAFYGGAGGPPLTLLSTYITLHPTAEIVNTDACLGGVRLRAGPGAPVWDNFEGNVDNYKIGVSGGDTIFNFEDGPPPIAECDPNPPTGDNGVGGVAEFPTEGSSPSPATSVSDEPAVSRLLLVALATAAVILAAAGLTLATVRRRIR